MNYLLSIKNLIKKFTFLVVIGVVAFKVITVLAIGFIFHCILDYFICLSSVWRVLFLVLILSVAIFWILRWKFNSENELENNFKEFKGRLFASLTNYPASLKYSEELIFKIREQTVGILSSLNLKPIIRRKLFQFATPLIISLFGVFICFVLLPAPKLTWVMRFFSPTNHFSLSISPGDKKVFYGDTVEISIIPERISPFKISLFVNNEHNILYKRDEFKTQLKAKEDIFYYAKSGGVQTDTYKISVLTHPSIAEFKLTYIYPEYTGLSPYTSIFPEISALYGTRVEFSAISNTDLDSAIINFTNGKVRCSVNNKNIVSSFKLDVDSDFKLALSDSYNIALFAQNGFLKETDFYPINITADEFPQVVVTFPGMDIEMPSIMKVPIIFQARDDYGLSQGILKCSTGISEVVKRWTLSSMDTSIYYEWHLGDILPGEVITYWVEVFDNNRISGPKVTKSKEFKIYFPTVEDIYKQVASELTQTQEWTSSELEDLSKELVTMEMRIKEVLSSVGTSEVGEPEWSDRQAIENLLRKEKEISERIEKLSSKIDELYKRAESAMWIDEETVQKIEQLQQLLADLNLPELQVAVEKLKEALKENPELLADALKNFKLSQEELKKRIEQTLALLEKYKQEQALKSLAERASELQQWQAEIYKKTIDASPEDKGALNQLSTEEAALSKELSNLKEDMQKLSKELDAFADDLSKESARADDIQSKLGEISKNLSRGHKPLTAQQKVSSELSSMSSSLFSMHQQLIEQERAQITKEVQAIINEFLFLSFKEEWLDGSPLDMAFEQEALIKGTKNAGERLKDLSKSSPIVSKGLVKYVSTALSSMEELKYKAEELSRKSLSFRRGEAVIPESFLEDLTVMRIGAMSSLNKVVAELIEVEDAVKSSSSPCGLPFLMHQLSQLTQRQENLNMLMQSFLPLSFSSSEMQQQIAQFMSEQQAISEALKQIADGLKGKTLGDLGAMAEEMERIARDLEHGVSWEIVERQERVLKHLLDAHKSIYTRKHSKQRISESGENFLKLPSLPEPELSTKYGISQKDIREGMQKDYPQEYEELIRAYFKAISK